MAAKYEIYKCEECGNVVMLLENNSCVLTCCGKNMVCLPEQTADSSTEKHVPLIEKADGGYKVTVGSTPHPMLDKHWIQWIELVVNGQRMIKELNPGEAPEVFFSCAHKSGDRITAREYCNVHGLWKSELK
ncbi:MAG: desulfoferrodoxin [Spirochaeta sp. LUC14_002_19_P3]|nr:MAG: desulfoferrodoxin [Spirochaeta sp. LUC14_002_19_P3]